MMYFPSLYFWLSSKASTYFHPSLRHVDGAPGWRGGAGATGTTGGAGLAGPCIARVAVDVGDDVEAGEEQPVLGRPVGDVYHVGESARRAWK